MKLDLVLQSERTCNTFIKYLPLGFREWFALNVVVNIFLTVIVKLT